MLLNKAELNLAKLASTDESRFALQGIAVQPSSTVVTNGHYLVSIGHIEGFAEENFPETPGLTHAKLQGTALVSRDAAIGAAKALPKKSTIPILQTAALGEDKVLYVNTLDSVQTFKSDLTGTFPQWDRIVPTAKPKADIVLNAGYLELLAKFIKENGLKNVAVRLTVYDNQTAVRFDAVTEDNQNLLAFLMPIRADHHSFAKRPHELKKEKKAAEEPKAEEVTKQS